MVFKYTAGLGNGASYIASSKPFLSSSIVVPSNASDVVRISFPNVSKFVTIRNMNDSSGPSRVLRFGFSHNGVSGSANYATLANEESYTGDFRVTEVFLRCDAAHANQVVTASVIAGMTGIGVSELPTNWSGSSGVG